MLANLPLCAAGDSPAYALLLTQSRIMAMRLTASGDRAPSAEAGTPDLSLHDARAGDRYLLCSDGLTVAVPVAVIRETLLAAGSAPSDVVARLISLANEAGGPDNIACVVADVLPAA